MLCLWLNREQLQLPRSSREIWRSWLAGSGPRLICIISPAQAICLLIWRILLGQTADIITGPGDSQKTLLYQLLWTYLPIQRKFDFFRIGMETGLPCHRAIPQTFLFILRFFFFTVKIHFSRVECLYYFNPKINNS